METKDQECCPQFHPEKWDQQTHEWHNKPFIKETISTFFHMPLPWMIDKKVTKMCKMAEDAYMEEPNKEEALLLFRDPTAFTSEIYLSVS